MIHNYTLLVPFVYFAFAEYCSLLQWSVRGSESQRNLSDAASFHCKVVQLRGKCAPSYNANLCVCICILVMLCICVFVRMCICVFVYLEIVRLFIRKVQLGGKCALASQWDLSDEQHKYKTQIQNTNTQIQIQNTNTKTSK